KILQVTSTTQYPVLDGNLITNVNAVKLQARNVAATAPSANQVLRWNNSLAQWEPSNDTNGTVTNITTGTGLLGGPVTSTGTLSVDVGTGPSQIVQLTSGSQIPAVDGNLIANVNAVKLQTRNVANIAPGDKQVLAWNAASAAWEPVSA